MRLLRHKLFWGMSLGAVLLSGCKREQVEVYNVPKEEARRTSHAGHDHGDGTASNPLADYRPDEEPSWKDKPASWQQGQPDQINFVNFYVFDEGKQVPKARISMTPLPLEMLEGRELEIINMWRGQVSLPEISVEAIAAQAQNVPIGPSEGKLFELAGEKPDRKGVPHKILVASVLRGNSAWYIKLDGEEAVVNTQKPIFVSFLKGLEFKAAAKETPATEPNWTAPAHWKKTAAPEFAVAAYSIEKEGQSARLSISQVGGSILDNINRWRGQLGLQPVDQSGLNQQSEKIEVPGGSAILVDIEGMSARTGKPEKTLGLLIPGGRAHWIYKLTGDPTVVSQEKAALIEFVKSAKPNA